MAQLGQEADFVLKELWDQRSQLRPSFATCCGAGGVWPLCVVGFGGITSTAAVTG